MNFSFDRSHEERFSGTELVNLSSTVCYYLYEIFITWDITFTKVYMQLISLFSILP